MLGSVFDLVTVSKLWWQRVWPLSDVGMCDTPRYCIQSPHCAIQPPKPWSLNCSALEVCFLRGPQEMQIFWGSGSCSPSGNTAKGSTGMLWPHQFFLPSAIEVRQERYIVHVRSAGEQERQTCGNLLLSRTNCGNFTSDEDPGLGWNAWI